MLEVLLKEYEQSFGEPFPLEELEGMREYEVLNILYDCILNAHPFDGNTHVKTRIADAPGQN